MDEDRPAKRTIRKLWLERIHESDTSPWEGPAPLYLTLSGASGRDIELIAKHSIVKKNEVGGIAQEDTWKVVAVESNLDAVLQLQKKFPGLKILVHPFQNLLRSTTLTRWPEGDDETYCKAHIINLDLNQPLASQDIGGHISFPLLQLIQKFAQIHANPPHSNWFLFLTLHGQITWDLATSTIVQAFLNENFMQEQRFAESCRGLFGNDLFTKLTSNSPIDLGGLNDVEQQKVLMAFVPKKISHLVVNQGWLVLTNRNIRYGGGIHAPMVSWIISFCRDARVSATPIAVYSECLQSILAGSGHIEENGHLS